jgi:hypothetical protein
MSVDIINITAEYADMWNKFVLDNPHGNIFQTYEMGWVYEAVKRLKAIRLMAIDLSNHKIYGGLIGYISIEKGGILRYISSRAIIQGGPLFMEETMDSDIIGSLLQSYDASAARYAIYSEIWNLTDHARFDRVIKQNNYQFIEHLNFLIDLQQPISAIWDNFGQYRKRNINRSQKKGVSILEVQHFYEIDIFYKLIEETYRRTKIPLAPKTLFTAVFDILASKGYAKFFLAEYQGEFIGARAILMYKGKVHDWYAGSRKDAHFLHPDESLVWHILKWSVANNYGIFDFGGAGRPDEEYGPREFKRRFGGKMVNFGRYRKVYAPIRTKIAEAGFKLYRKIPN